MSFLRHFSSADDVGSPEKSALNLDCLYTISQMSLRRNCEGWDLLVAYASLTHLPPPATPSLCVAFTLFSVIQKVKKRDRYGH